MTILYDIFVWAVFILRTALELLGIVVVYCLVRDIWNDLKCRRINKKYQAHRLQQIKDGIYGT